MNPRIITSSSNWSMIFCICSSCEKCFSLCVICSNKNDSTTIKNVSTTELFRL